MSRRKHSHGCIGSLVKLIALLCRGLDFRRKPTAKKKGSKVWLEELYPIPGERRMYEAKGPSVELHFALIDRIEAAWKAGNRAKVVALCHAQIDLAKDVLMIFSEEAKINRSQGNENQIKHTGFYRLAMLYEKEGNFSEAIRVCEQGIAIGWSQGELVSRAERCRKKLAKGVESIYPPSTCG